jgi:hypothetical protein
MSTTTRVGREADQSGQHDDTSQTGSAAQIITPGLRISRDTPARTKQTQSEFPWIEFSFELICNISAPCSRQAYRTAPGTPVAADPDPYAAYDAVTRRLGSTRRTV